jgi:hypothetical protein
MRVLAEATAERGVATTVACELIKLTRPFGPDGLRALVDRVAFLREGYALLRQTR